MNEPEDNSTCLHKAILYGRRDTVKSLLDGGADVNASHKFYNAPLHVAAEEGCAQTVRELLTRGAKVDERTRLLNGNYTALHIAVKKSNLEVASLLLSSGADVDARSDDGWTPLHLACKQPSGEPVVRLLLDNRADVAAVTGDDRTPLGIACSSRNDAAVRLLLEHGAKPNARDANGKTALHLALEETERHSSFQPTPEQARISQRNVVEALLARGDTPVNAKDVHGKTPLFHAVGMYDVAIVRMLLERGARVDTRDADGRTPLHCFAADGVSKRFIRDNCSRKPDCSEQFQRLVDSTQAEIARLLLERGGADVDSRQRDELQSSALHVAASKNYNTVVEALLRHGAEVNCRDARGSTPLHFACKNGCLEVVETLLRSGADVNILDQHASTPLHFADDFDEEVAEALQRHILKLRLADLELCQQNQVELCALDEQISIDYCIKCMEQVEMMKETRFHETTVSFYDVVAKDSSELTALLRNSSILETLESGDYREVFTEYADLIGNSFERGKKRRQLLDRVWTSDLFNSIFSNVPRICVEQILGYLDVSDLRCLVQSD